MKVHALANVLLLTNAVYADYLTAKSRDIGNNVDLGHLSDVGLFTPPLAIQMAPAGKISQNMKPLTTKTEQTSPRVRA